MENGNFGEVIYQLLESFLNDTILAIFNGEFFSKHTRVCVLGCLQMIYIIYGI